MLNLVDLILISLGIIIIVFFIILFVVYYTKKQTEQRMRLREMESEMQRKLLENSLQVQESERQRIARDLHDEIGAMLSATKISFNTLGKQLSGNNSHNSYSNTKSMLDESIAKVRQISKELIPSTLNNFGLLAALEDFLDKIKNATNLRIVLTTNLREDARLDKKLELMVFRIVQELVNNTIKHSGATEIEVNITENSQEIRLNFHDNGVGFDINEVYRRPDAGLGLRNIESRVNVINGELSVFSKPNTGTRFDIRIPLIQ